MAVEIKVPTLGESVTEATVAKWLKQAGDTVAVDEALCELETDKVTVEVNATAAGVLGSLMVEEGGTVQVGAVLCLIEEGAGAAAASPAPAAKPASAPAVQPSAPAASAAAAGSAAPNLAASGPAARKLAAESGADVSTAAPSAKGGRLT